MTTSTDEAERFGKIIAVGYDNERRRVLAYITYRAVHSSKYAHMTMNAADDQTWQDYQRDHPDEVPVIRPSNNETR